MYINTDKTVALGTTLFHLTRSYEFDERVGFNKRLHTFIETRLKQTFRI